MLSSYAHSFKPLTGQESSYSLTVRWRKQRGGRAGGRNRDTDTESDEYKEQDVNGGWVSECEGNNDGKTKTEEGKEEGDRCRRVPSIT